MCARAADTNVASKEKELQQLLEVLRIKAETFVLVWDHLASMLERSWQRTRSKDGDDYEFEVEPVYINTETRKDLLVL